MALPQENGYTYADVLEWEDGTCYELYNGQPRALSAPSDVHQEISIELSTQLHTYLRGKTCKVYTAPFDVRLFEAEGDHPEDIDTVVQPDITVVCDKNKVDRRGIHGAPDMVIEILSPATRKHDRLIKFGLYQRAGVKEYWIVDPESQMVMVHVMEEGQYPSPEVYTSKASVPVSILEDFSVDLTSVFPVE